MIANPQQLFQRLRQRFLLAPAGHGRPIDRSVADGEYRSGHWAHFDSAAEEGRYAMLVRRIGGRYARPSVLDVGCGPGRLAAMLQVHCPSRYVGVDFSEEALVRARQAAWPRCEFVTGDFETWRPAGLFDAIVFNEVVGYARDPGALVAAFLPFLTPTGSILVSHFRSGHWVALWRRVERQVIVQTAETITNHLGQAWDIKVLCPRSR